MKQLFDKVSMQCSYLTTKSYSTSFSLAINCLDSQLREPICAIYGFVRLADEIVDSFHDYNKANLLERFRTETYRAIDDKISLNPILNSFQHAVNHYDIDPELIERFFFSMKMDLTETRHNPDTFDTYVLGSAEVVGLMCLKVFCNGQQEQYDKLKPYAMKLGAAFQKINFLRDLKDDYLALGRSYFPGVNMDAFDEHSKSKIEESIEEDFRQGFKGIRQLPRAAKFGVYLAYVYYYELFTKIRKTPSVKVLRKRIRIPNQQKFSILFCSYLKHRFNLI